MLYDQNFHIGKQKVEVVLGFCELDDVIIDSKPS